MVKVSVIITNYNGKKFLKDCFNSLKKQSIKDLEVILVDNASSDGSVEYIKSNFPWVTLIANDTNLGFSEGNNVGYRVAKGKYILLLNNDTIAHKDLIKEMIKEIEKDKKIAIVGSYGHSFDTNLAEAKIKEYSTIGLTAVDILLPFLDKIENKSLYVGGYCCLLKRGVFNTLFDKDYFCYSEDIYLGWLAWLKGYKVVYSKARLLHYGGGTIEDKSSFSTYYVERNSLMNFLIFFEIKNIIKIAPLYFLSTLVKFSHKLATFNFSRALALLKGQLWVLFHLRKILEKRRQIQQMRKVPDSQVMSVMSYKILGEKEGFSFISKSINYFSRVYTKLLNISTIEYEKI